MHVGVTRHPYTKALLSAVPALRKEHRFERIRITGEPMSPIGLSPKCCRFHSRCSKGEERCMSEMPILRPYCGGLEMACHFPEEYADPPRERVRIA